MGKHQMYEKRTEELISPILEENHFELVDVEFVKEAGSWHLRAYIDKEGGITIDDLTLVNHAFEQKGKKYTDKEFIGILKSYEAPQEDSVNGGKIVLGFDGEETLELEIKDIALIRKSIDF